MKKLCSILLSALLLLTLIPTASAASPVSEPEIPALVIGGRDVTRGRGFLRSVTWLTQKDLDSLAASASGEATYRLGLGDCFTETETYSTFEDHGVPTWIYRRVCGLDIPALADALGVDTGKNISVFVSSDDGSSHTLTDAFGTEIRRYEYSVEGEPLRQVGPILALFQTKTKSTDGGHPGSAVRLPPAPVLGADSPDRVAPLFGYGQTAVDDDNSCHWVKGVTRLRIGVEDPALTVTGPNGEEKAVSLSSVVQMGIYKTSVSIDSGTAALTGIPLPELLERLGFDAASALAVSADGAETELPDTENLFAAWAAAVDGSAVENATAIRLYDLETGREIADVNALRITEANAPFADLDGYGWAQEAIGHLFRSGVVNGVAEGRFAPASPIRRGDFVLMLARAYGLDAGSGEGFSDVPVGSYYHDAILAAQAMGIARGSGGLFRPEDPITRQEAMALICRTLDYLGHPLPASGDLTAFSDGDTVSPWARDAVSALVGAGIINGSGGRLNPFGSMTRAEMSVALYRALTGVQ